jgi:hypothetical protein
LTVYHAKAGSPSERALCLLSGMAAGNPRQHPSSCAASSGSARVDRAARVVDRTVPTSPRNAGALATIPGPPVPDYLSPEFSGD